MPSYLVTLESGKSGQNFQFGANACVVEAASATIAKQMAASIMKCEGSAWITNGTATEITVAADWVGWTVDIVISGGVGHVSFVGTATDNTMDKIAAQLVTKLNALSLIAGAAYNTSTNTLTVAETTDGLGDHTIYVSIIPPNGVGSVAGLVGAITHGGLSGAALSVILPLDAAVIPSVPVYLKQV